MPNSGHDAVKTDLASQFDHTRRFGLVRSGCRAAAEDLVRIARASGIAAQAQLRPGV